MFGIRIRRGPRKSSWSWRFVVMVWCLLFLSAAGAAMAFSITALDLTAQLLREELLRDAALDVGSSAEPELLTRSHHVLGLDSF